MKIWTIEDGQKILSEIKDVDEIEKSILKLKLEYGEKNLIFFLVNPKGDYMQFGISNELCFLNYHNEKDEPPYYSSVNSNMIYKENEKMIFQVCGNYTEIPYRNCIDFDKVLETLKQYFQTNKLPDIIAWEED